MAVRYGSGAPPAPAGRPPVQSAAQIQQQVQANGGLLGLQPNKLKVWIPGVERRQTVLPNDTGVFNKPHSQITQYAPPSEMSKDEALNLVYDPSQAEKILKELQARGIQVNSFNDLEKIWTQAVNRAAKVYTYSHMEKSPWDMLDLVANKPSRGAPNFPWKGKSFDETHTTKNIEEMGPEVARNILSQALTQALGRQPTTGEIENFASRANAIVSANPQISETTAHNVWDPNANGPGQGGYVQTGTTTRQVGPSAEEISAKVQNEAQDQAMAKPEYGAYQAAVPLFNALLQAIQSPVGG